MIIISHRGYWKTPEEKNTVDAFHQSFSLGYGTETDVRDYNGELVISHDIASAESISIDNFFRMYKEYHIGASAPLALNIKADGLQKLLQKKLIEYDITNYFLFDMSIPDLKVSIDLGFNVFERLSEYETTLPFYDQTKGVWLDAFNEIWYDKSIISKHIGMGKSVCIVSSELHKKDYRKQWDLLKEYEVSKINKLMLCTDLPEEASEFFGV